MAQQDTDHATDTGPVLLLAGPGTGKTHDLARRVRWLVLERQPSVDPRDITVITFTVEAARNMRWRMSDQSKEKDGTFVPPDFLPKVSTMHSLGNSILQDLGASIGLSPDFAVLPRGPIRELLFQDCARLAGRPEVSGKDAAKCRTQGDCREDDSDRCKVCKLYTKLLRANRTIDHDDQIAEACKALRASRAGLSKYMAQAQHLLVDEYQGINQAQFELIQILTGGQTEGLFVVGDDDQSIYEFRGGSVKFIKRFANDFGNDTIKHKTLSRRCPGHILHGALDVARRFNRDRIGQKPEMCCQEDGSKILAHRFPNDTKEADWIARETKDRFQRMDVLILVPTGNYIPTIARALRHVGVSYRARLTVEKTELNLFAALQKWLEKPSDSFTLRLLIERMVESQHLGIPSSKVKKAEKRAERDAALKRISDLWHPVLDEECSLYDAILRASPSDELVRLVGCSLQRVQTARSGSALDFLSAVSDVFKPWKQRADDMVAEFDEWIALAQSVSAATSVRVMTMQGSKGLEADCVFIVGADDGVLPKAKPGTPQEAVESRLFFVSMTRAKRELHLCHSVNRSGGATFLSNSYALKQSRFTAAIAKEHLTHVPHD